jgi:class 3 adenylate cyclase
MAAYRRRVGAWTALGLTFLVWLTCFALSVEDAVRETAYDPLLVEFGAADGYPRFAGWKAGREQPQPALARGDAIVAISGVDLRGAGPASWVAAFARHDGPAAPIDVEVARDGARRHALVVAGSYRDFWPRLLASLAFVGGATCLLFLARPSRLVDAIVWTDMAAATFFACTFAGGPIESGLGFLVHVVSLALAAPLALRAALLFPRDRAPTSAVARIGPWAFASLGLFDASRFYGVPLSHAAGALGSAVVGVAYVVASSAVSVRTYLRSDALEQRQMRWMFLAGYLITLPFVVAVVLTAFDPGLGHLLAIAISAFGLLPIATTIALVRTNLFDVDRLLGSAASYTVILVIVLTGALWAVPALADTLHETTGVESRIAQMVLAFALALGLVRLHGSVRPEIDRVFFADRWAFEQGMHALMDDLSRCTSAGELATTAGARVADGLRLDTTLVALEADDAFVPLFVRGRPTPTPLPRGGALITTLAQSGRVLAADDQGLDPFERAVLRSLDAPLVVPIENAGRVQGVLALGHKSSGDVFTSTERALIAAVADKIASELRRLAQAEQLAASDRERAALGQYVEPGIADRVRRGEAVDLGERELSVLFADLRGYTAWAQDRPLTELHATVNQYVETVARIVREHAGTVVDFVGDGMMAVFGAPDELAGKERAAVAAARRIVDTVRGLAVLAPGVGVATGPAWVGTVRVGAKLHWSALGDTVNVASRLQGMTRELSAWIAVDELTWQRAGAEREALEPRGATAIRGRSAAEMVYVLPITPA